MNKMGGKLLLGILISVFILSSTFLVIALTNQDAVSEGNVNLATQENSEVEDDAVEDETEDVPITGNALETASAAALEYIGEGRVTDTEIGDEEGYYEIEITLDNGKEVDVHLDENFNVLSVEN